MFAVIVITITASRARPDVLRRRALHQTRPIPRVKRQRRRTTILITIPNITSIAFHHFKRIIIARVRLIRPTAAPTLPVALVARAAPLTLPTITPRACPHARPFRRARHHRSTLPSPLAISSTATAPPPTGIPRIHAAALIAAAALHRALPAPVTFLRPARDRAAARIPNLPSPAVVVVRDVQHDPVVVVRHD